VEARFPRRDVAGGAGRATAVHRRWPTAAGWAVMLTVAVLLSSMVPVQVAEAQSAGACQGAAVGQAGGAAKPAGGLGTAAGAVAGGAAKPSSGLGTDVKAIGSACQGVAGQASSIRKAAAQSESSQGASTRSSKIGEGLVDLVRAVGEGIG
jgi:hypothetical protein